MYVYAKYTCIYISRILQAFELSPEYNTLPFITSIDICIVGLMHKKNANLVLSLSADNGTLQLSAVAPFGLSLIL